MSQTGERSLEGRKVLVLSPQGLLPCVFTCHGPAMLGTQLWFGPETLRGDCTQDGSKVARKVSPGLTAHPHTQPSESRGEGPGADMAWGLRA